MTAKPLVAVVMGSDSDLEIMREAGKALDEFGIPTSGSRSAVAGRRSAAAP